MKISYAEFASSWEAHFGRKLKRAAPETWADVTCPGHDDASPSLGVLAKQDGGVRFKCQAGCDRQAVLAGLKANGAHTKLNGHDADPQKRAASKVNGFAVAGPAAEWYAQDGAQYPYRDTRGVEKYEVTRKHLDPLGKKKKFPQARIEPGGRRVRTKGCMDDVRRLPYRLPELVAGVKAGEPIFVVEGEKDVHALVDRGHVATCNPGGARKWRKEFAAYLKGADVTIVADKDKPGRKHAREVEASLNGVAKSVRVVEAREGKDPYDHLAAGFGVDDLVEVPDARQRALIVTPASAFERRIVEWLDEPRVPIGTLTILAGFEDAGKTAVACNVAAAISRGLPLFGQAGKKRSPGNVLYFYSEDDVHTTLRPRIEDAGGDTDRVFFVEGTREPDGTKTSVSLATDLDAIERELIARRYDLLALDPLASVHPDLHDSKQLRPLLDRVKRIAEENKTAVLALVHFRKSSTERAAHRSLGDVTLIAAARSGLVIAEDPFDKTTRVLAQTKMNIAKKATSLAFKIGEGAQVTWKGASPLSAEQLLETKEERERHAAVTQRDDAMTFLREVLADGPLPHSEILKKRDEALFTFSDRTLDRARKDLCVVARQIGAKGSVPQHWEWSLPTPRKFDPSAQPSRRK